MKAKLFVVLSILAVFLVGCGGPKADVSIFVLPSSGMPIEIAEKLQSSLQSQLGEAPTVKVSTSPIFSMEKLVVEVAAGGHGIVILPKEQWLGLAGNGGMVPLDDLFNPADYPEGVVELPVSDREGPKEKHLYAVPISNTKWMKDIGYKGEELFAFVHPRADRIDQVRQVLKTIMQTP